MAGHHSHEGGGSVVHSSSDEEPLLQTISEELWRSSIERGSVIIRVHGVLNVAEAPENLDAELIPTSQHNWQSPQETQSEANRDPANQDPSNQDPSNQDPSNQDPSNQDPPNENPHLED
ncbi:hypothetical protein AB5N19_11174 [Seiridium cardinale]|uniref:Uncharacterized protein n=1 Tax=Seiridium cardinale TaxID=138064 RepID=A0ABR2XS37_9PEZI